MAKARRTIEECIGEAVRRLRDTKRLNGHAATLTQRELAARAKVPHSTVAAIELGRRLNHTNLKAIATVYGMRYADLVADAETRLNAR